MSLIHNILLVTLTLGAFLIPGDGGMTESDGSTVIVGLEVIEANVSPSIDVTNTPFENVTEMDWMEAAEMESKKKSIKIGWEEGVNPLTTYLDCCFGVDELDCIEQCILGDESCNLTCGSLLFPENPKKDQYYTTLLTTEPNGLVWLRIAITDLRHQDKISVSYTMGGTPIAEITCESFTEEEMEKFFTSKEEQLYVTYQMLTVENGENGCSQWEAPSKNLYFRAVSKTVCDNEIVINDADTQGKLFSPPDSPYPPLRDCSWTIKASSEGFGIGLFVDELDLNGFYGDHIRINAGGPQSFISRGYILTWSMSPSQQYLKVFPGGIVTLYFHTGRHLAPTKHKGFEIEYRQFGNGSVPDESTTSSSTMVTPSDGYSTNASIYFAGKTPNDVYKEQSSIKQAFVNLANNFCDLENITLEEPITFKDIYFHRIMHCPSTWPYSSICAEVIIQIVAHTVSGKYELTDSNILKMWEKYGFDRNMTVTGIMPYQQDPAIIKWWLVALVGALLLFVAILITAWCNHKHMEHAKYVSQLKKSKQEAEEFDDNKFQNISEKVCPFKIMDEEDDDDDISLSNDRKDSYYDYDNFGSTGGSTYYSYNDGIGLSITGEKVNHAFIPDEIEELDEVDLGRDDFKFQFVPTTGGRASQNYDMPIHQKVIQIDGNVHNDESETIL